MVVPILQLKLGFSWHLAESDPKVWQNHRLVLRRELKDLVVAPMPWEGTFHQARLLRAPSSLETVWGQVRSRYVGTRICRQNDLKNFQRLCKKQTENHDKINKRQQTSAKFKEIRINVSTGISLGKSHINCSDVPALLLSPLIVLQLQPEMILPLPQAEFNLPPCQQLAPPRHSQRHFGHCQDYLHCQRKDCYPLN